MCAEEVGSEFGAAHVVEDLFALFQILVAVNVLGSEAAIETHVTVVLEDGVVARFDDSGIFSGIGKLAVVRAQLGADDEATLFLNFGVAQLLSAGLDGEIGLALGDDFLGWIGILDDEIAGVARHHHGFEREHGTAANFDHLVGSDKMVFDRLIAA